MTDKFNKLNETFEVEGEVISKEIKKVEPKKLSEEDIQKDYEYTRGNLYSLIEKGQEVLMVLLNWHKKQILLEHMKLLVN